MIQRLHLVIVSLVLGCLLLQGCQSVKKTLGIHREPPDEFAVTPSCRPLDMPPDFDFLPTPQPGKPSPQEERALNAQKEKFLGKNPQGAPSTGQTALRTLCNVQNAQEDIREVVDKETLREKAQDKTVLERLGIKKVQPKKEDVVNASEEAKRLQEEGIPHGNRPVPDDLPPN